MGTELALLLWILALTAGIITARSLYHDFYPKEKTPKEHEKRNPIVITAIIVVVILGLTLPFHYVKLSSTLFDFKIFPKEHFTFDHTFIDKQDIGNVIERYNKANVIEQITMRNDPFVNKLFEQGLIGNK